MKYQEQSLLVFIVSSSILALAGFFEQFLERGPFESLSIPFCPLRVPLFQSGLPLPKLSVDLADKALTIRKLLEDNQYLQNKLTSAQGQAATLIDEAKKQMGTIERSDHGLQHVPARETSPTLVAGSRENDPHQINGGMNSMIM